MLRASQSARDRRMEEEKKHVCMKKESWEDMEGWTGSEGRGRAPASITWRERAWAPTAGVGGQTEADARYERYADEQQVME